MDYRLFYEPDKHIADKFEIDGKINAIEFFAILDWKSARATRKHLVRLKAKYPNRSFEQISDFIVDQIKRQSDDKSKLKFLMEGPKFLLPTASAILTALYPSRFSVFDRYVQDEIIKSDRSEVGEHKEMIRKLTWQTSIDEIWQGYKKYLELVNLIAPSDMSLRDKDKYLWGKGKEAALKIQLEKQWKVRS